MNEQQVGELAFARFAELAKGQKLPCEFAPAREINVDEFMFMGSTERIYHFKHRDTRNYVDIINGKLVIRPSDEGKPGTYFDTNVMLDFESEMDFHERNLNVPKKKVEVCVEVRIHTSVIVNAPLKTDGFVNFDDADKLARWETKNRYYYVGDVDVVIVDHNTEVL